MSAPVHVVTGTPVDTPDVPVGLPVDSAAQAQELAARFRADLKEIARQERRSFQSTVDLAAGIAQARVGESVQALAEAAGGTALEMVAGESKAVSHGHTRMVTCLAFAPDGSALVSTSRDGCARLLHVHVSDCQRNLDVDLGGIDLVLTRDGENKAAAPPVAGSKGLPGLPLASPSSLALSLARALPLLCACWLGAATRGCLQA